MKNLIKTLLSVFAIMIIVSTSQAQLCPPSHCSGVKDQINNLCKQLGQAGNLIITEYPAGSGNYCYCKCSCLSSSTPVEVSKNNWKQIGEIEVGETVLGLNKNGKWQDSKVIFSDGTIEPNAVLPYAIYILTENDVTFIVTADHLFLMSDGTLKRADRLTLYDKLTSSNNKGVAIKTLTHGSYIGPIHNIAINNWDTLRPKIEEHLINTNGIVSGDYFAQLWLGSESQKATPQIGSVEYMAKHAANRSFLQGVESLKDTIDFGDNYMFIPAKGIKYPKEAIHFLPEGFDEAKPGMLADLDNTISYEMAEYLVWHFNRFYPSITFHVDWNNNSVNAIAYRQNGKQHVSIFGGLLRHNYIKIEAAGLVLAHEIGHHFGGKPRYTQSGLTWASCEGQSDYWGAMVAMRNVWWGPYYIENIERGSQQLYNLFCCGLTKGNILTLSFESTEGLCSHPPAACRLDTYKAAMHLKPKPSCAGD